MLLGSPADKDGRIQKGDRILSINGRNMKGVTHREALSILKVYYGKCQFSSVNKYYNMACVCKRALLAGFSSFSPLVWLFFYRSRWKRRIN